jgi:RimJ/RimL family protein N-acetyltransferase
LINSVLSNIQAGFVYADAAADCFFAVTKSGFSLYHSRQDNSEFDHEFFDFLKQNRNIPDYMHFYSPPVSFQNYISSNWGKYKIRRRAQFRHCDKNITSEYERLLPAGYRIATLQQVGFDRLARAFELDFENRYWNSRQEFLAGAIGACLLNEKDDPAAICYSACIVDGIAEVDTLVLPAYRGRGLLKIVAGSFFNLAAQNNLIPHWDAFISNSASYAMGQKFGMQLQQEYDLLSLLLR